MRKAAVALLALAFCAAYIYFAGRDLRADHLASSRARRDLEAASRLEPWNAEYADRLGRQDFYAAQDVPKALREFERATALDPGAAQYWMDLALARGAAGQREGERQALEQALRAEPTTPAVAWDAAGLYFMLGDVRAAMAELRVVLQYEPWAVSDAMLLAWRATHDAPAIFHDALPDEAPVRLRFLSFLLDENQPAAAGQVWSEILAAKEPFPAAPALPYVQYLLDHKQVPQARQVWRDLATGDRSFAAYLPSSGLEVNGGFEQEIQNAGFDWRYRTSPHVLLAIDSADAHAGQRSLVMTFDGGVVTELGLWQMIAVEPGTRYEISAYSQAQEWSGETGLRLAVEDAYDHTPYGATEPLATTAGWRRSSGSFTTGPQTTLVMVKLVADRAGALRGRVWLDDVSVTQP